MEAQVSHNVKKKKTGMQNVDLEGSLVLYLCFEDTGVKKLLNAEGNRFDWNLNMKVWFTW